MNEIQMLIDKIWEKAKSDDKELQECMAKVRCLLEGCESTETRITTFRNVTVRKRMKFSWHTSRYQGDYILFKYDIVHTIVNENKIDVSENVNKRVYDYEPVDKALKHLFNAGRLKDFMEYLSEIALPQFLNGNDYPAEFYF